MTEELYKAWCMFLQLYMGLIYRSLLVFVVTLFGGATTLNVTRVSDGVVENFKKM